MNQNHCQFCHRTFRFADLYEQHVPTCEFFYKTQRDRLRDSEMVDNVPCSAEMFRLVKYLMLRDQQHEERIARLELALRRVKKRAILENTPKPTVSLAEWTRACRVQVAHIHHVFQEDLYEGIRRCLGERLDQEGLDEVPLRVSPEQPNVIHVWEGGKWRPCAWSDLRHMFQELATAFMDAYCQWEDENIVFLQSSPENKDKQVVYMLKMSDSAACAKNDRRCEELRQWLRKKLVYKEPGAGAGAAGGR